MKEEPEIWQERRLHGPLNSFPIRRKRIGDTHDIARCSQILDSNHFLKRVTREWVFNQGIPDNRSPRGTPATLVPVPFFAISPRRCFRSPFLRDTFSSSSTSYVISTGYFLSAQLIRIVFVLPAFKDLSPVLRIEYNMSHLLAAIR